MFHDNSEYSITSVQSDTTPLKLRNQLIDNLQNEKKRAPSTPLTPSLIQKNIMKKRVSDIEIGFKTNDQNEEFNMIQTKNSKEDDLNLNDELANQENSENYLFTQGSPKSKKSILNVVNNSTNESKLSTPKITAGIKRVVKEQKKSRLQIIKNSERNADRSFSETEYSETSTISGDTPNYKLQEDLVYYKNGYYINSNNDDSFYEAEKNNLINEKELNRVNDLLNFMKKEREFQS